MFFALCERTSSATKKKTKKKGQKVKEKKTRKILEEIAQFLSCNLLTVKRNHTKPLKLEPIDTLSVSVTSLDKIEPLLNYFNKYPLLGVKGLDFKDWEIVYHMIKSAGRSTE